MSTLIVQREGELTRLTLNRPDKANALDAALVEALLGAVTIAHNDGTRLLVLDANGRNFSAGFDFGDYETQSEGDLLLRFVRIEQLLQAVSHAPFATLALAQGRNFGAGADLFLAASLRVCTADSSFRMPGLRFGLQLGTRRLAARIGDEAARALLADSLVIDAEEALDLGFASELVKATDWAGLAGDVLQSALLLSPEAAARLHAATLRDTRALDMADLVASAAAPGIKARIAQFREKA